MNYNQFYKKKDKYKRKMSPAEKANAKRLGISFSKSILAGMTVGLIFLILYKIMM